MIVRARISPVTNDQLKKAILAFCCHLKEFANDKRRIIFRIISWQIGASRQ